MRTLQFAPDEEATSTTLELCTTIPSMALFTEYCEPETAKPAKLADIETEPAADVHILASDHHSTNRTARLPMAP